MVLQCPRRQWLETSELHLVVQCVVQRFLVARQVGFPSFDPCWEFQQRALSRRNDRAKQTPLSSSCRRVASFRQSSPCLRRVLPQVGDNVISLITREGHECCVHLLQHELQIMHSSLPVRRSRHESRSMSSCMISVTCSSEHSNIISDSLITPAKNASVFFGQC